jgi:hypothetical protein
MPSEMQYDVRFLAQPAIERAGEFAQYHLSKVALSGILANWPLSSQWIAKSPGRKASGQYHPTAISRSRVSAPLREYLTRVGRANGMVLYHGVGRDEIGAQALQMRGQVMRYDPHHPDAEVRQHPAGPFDEVHSHYTLNVVDADTGHDILTQIHAVLSDRGVAVVTVRRDLDRRRDTDNAK